MDTEVLIVGAGPTGLVLALWLTRLGVRVRIIDKLAEPGTTSRALAVQVRTLELYRQLGLAQEIVDAGLELTAANLWARARRVARVQFGKLGAMSTPYTSALFYPQDEHERFLIARLAELNVHVERDTELFAFDTYEPERIAFARQLVATTNSAFELVTKTSRLAAFVRVHLAPRVLALPSRVRAFRRLLFRVVSQTGLNYRESELSEGRAGKIAGGDRLPWTGPEADNFQPLRSLGWQAHVYGTVLAAFSEACTSRKIPLHAFPWSEGARRAGLQRDSAYLVRPDGHVALADSRQSAEELHRYLDARGVRLTA